MYTQSEFSQLKSGYMLQKNKMPYELFVSKIVKQAILDAGISFINKICFFCYHKEKEK